MGKLTLLRHPLLASFLWAAIGLLGNWYFYTRKRNEALTVKDIVFAMLTGPLFLVEVFIFYKDAVVFNTPSAKPPAPAKESGQ